MKRLKKGQRIEITKKIRASGLKLLKNKGKLKKINGTEGEVLIATFKNLEILHTMPSSGAKGTPRNYGLDIWLKNKGKVFSIWWDAMDSDEPIKIVNFKYGEWMNIIVPGTYP